MSAIVTQIYHHLIIQVAQHTKDKQDREEYWQQLKPHLVLWFPCNMVDPCLETLQESDKYERQKDDANVQAAAPLLVHSILSQQSIALLQEGGASLAHKKFDVLHQMNTPPASIGSVSGKKKAM